MIWRIFFIQVSLLQNGILQHDFTLTRFFFLKTYYKTDFYNTICLRKLYYCHKIQFKMHIFLLLQETSLNFFCMYSTLLFQKKSWYASWIKNLTILCRCLYLNFINSFCNIYICNNMYFSILWSPSQERRLYSVK